MLFFSSFFGYGQTDKKPADAKEPSKSIYSFKIMSLEGKEVDFSQYKGKKLLIVNTASKCGFTPQYDDLEKLYQKYNGKLEVLGFPCNDFKEQEPENASAIKEFCKVRFGVTFPLFEKVHVKGDEKHPLYKWLTDPNENGWNSKEPGWNFCKYLINEKGELVGFYGSSVKPFDKSIISEIEK